MEVVDFNGNPRKPDHSPQFQRKKESDFLCRLKQLPFTNNEYLERQVSYFSRQLETPKTSNYCLKNGAQTAFQVDHLSFTHCYRAWASPNFKWQIKVQKHDDAESMFLGPKWRKRWFVPQIKHSKTQLDSNIANMAKTTNLSRFQHSWLFWNRPPPVGKASGPSATHVHVHMPR